LSYGAAFTHCYSGPFSVHSFEFDKKKITVEARVPVLTLMGGYTVRGKLITLPIAGSGNFTGALCEYFLPAQQCKRVLIGGEVGET
jgi:hypothetical protein